MQIYSIFTEKLKEFEERTHTIPFVLLISKELAAICFPTSLEDNMLVQIRYYTGMGKDDFHPVRVYVDPEKGSGEFDIR